MNDLETALKTLRKINRLERENRKIAKLNRQFEIESGTEYTLELIYKKPLENGMKFEDIELEGWKNTINLYERYKKIGHTLGLATASIYLDGKRVKKVNFKY